MALTLEAEQKLQAAGLIDYFVDNSDAWTTASRDTFLFVQRQFPNGSQIRPDDVAKALKPIVEVDPGLRAALDESRLKQKYWMSHFTDLVIDRCWDAISAEDGHDEAAENPE